jgi:hypothetical protein
MPTDRMSTGRKRARQGVSGHMPITPFLGSRVFGPEAVTAMGIAFEKACQQLGLSLRPDAATETVANVIIELAEAGERDAERLYQATLARFGKSG